MNGQLEFGRLLYELLPEVYRTRDNAVRDSNGKITGKGDQAKYLDACGQLLDLIKATLDQRLGDCHPDTCQGWLLPYFADLLDVRLVSPDEAGQRDEIAHAVSWRKGKGTMSVAEQIADAVGRFQGEVQEGWQRVAVTPRLGMPLLPATALGESADLDPGTATASEIAKQPGLPAVTPDLRQASCAMLLDADSKPTARKMGNRWWYQANLHGNPCHPGSFDDVSRRTADIRTPDWRQGHDHPRRLLIYMPPPEGFYPVAGEIDWADVPFIDKDGVLAFDNSGGALQSIGNIPSSLDAAKTYRLVNVILNGTVKITQGRLELERVAAEKIVVDSAVIDQPALKAKDCLFSEVGASKGLCRLEYCTVMGTISCKHLLASDCLFAGAVEGVEKFKSGKGSPPPVVNCIRYSRVPESLFGAAMKPVAEALKLLDTDGSIRLGTNTCASPDFYEMCYCIDTAGACKLDYRAPQFAEAGYGVLHPATPAAIRFGAEDGGEMGAYHHKYYCLSQAAVIDKLRDYLPLGIEPVLVPDAWLGCFQDGAAQGSGNQNPNG